MILINTNKILNVGSPTHQSKKICFTRFLGKSMSNVSKSGGTKEKRTRTSEEL